MNVGNLIWVQTNDIFRKMSGPLTSFDSLPKGIYKVDISQDTGEFYLKFLMDKFEFNYKLYDLQSDFINHVLKTFANTTGNLGILLNGTKGTGKTICAKMIANEMNLPIIIVQNMSKNNVDLMTWLSTEINFDCIFFFDEYEKTFGENSSILSFMDGVYNQPTRKVFLLTTNTLDIDDNLINRPSRIRYLKTFGNLSREIVADYLNDNLIDKSHTNDILDFVDTLTISTIDILKTIVQEINIHGYDEFMKIRKSFNIQTEKYTYRCTLGYVNLGESNISNTSITEFLKTKKNCYDKIVPAPNEYNFKDSSDYDKAYDEWSSKYQSDKYSFNYTEVEVEKKLQNLSKGDIFNNDKIIDIDLKHQVVVAVDSNFINFYYVNNPNTKPSLWSPKECGFDPHLGYLS